MSSCGGLRSTCSPAGSSASAVSACWPTAGVTSDWLTAVSYWGARNRSRLPPPANRPTVRLERRRSIAVRSVARAHSSLSPGLPGLDCQNWSRALTSRISLTAHDPSRAETSNLFLSPRVPTPDRSHCAPPAHPAPTSSAQSASSGPCRSAAPVANGDSQSPAANSHHQGPVRSALPPIQAP